MSKRGLPEVGRGREESGRGTGKDPAGPVGAEGRAASGGEKGWRDTGVDEGAKRTVSSSRM